MGLGGGARERLDPAERYGPPSLDDGPWKARMRFHQSWYRDRMRLQQAYGIGPHRTSLTRYGNMLDPRGEKEGRNFITPGILQVVDERIAAGGGVDPFRCKRNMLSSQPMAFNLFGPLCGNGALATQWIQSLIAEVEAVTDVKIEYAPQPPAEFLGDLISFDVFVEVQPLEGVTRPRLGQGNASDRDGDRQEGLRRPHPRARAEHQGGDQSPSRT
jgi:hypothetical protein